MNILSIVLRLIHILAGVFWVGGAWMMKFYIAPTVGSTAESGQQFMRHFVGKTNLLNMMMAAAGLAVTAGAILFIRNPPGWASSSAGIGFGIGAFFALIGFVFGILIGRNTRAVMGLGSQIKGQPTPEQLAQMQMLQKRLGMYSTINAYSLLLAVTFMATARYFIF